jgi:phage major head subunit gpT-like protein
MQITPVNLKFLFQQYGRQFQSMFDVTPTTWQAYASEVPSSTSENVYGWLAQFGGMRKWEGSRQAVDAAGRSYTLRNAPFERTVELDLDKVSDDQYGFFGAVVENLARVGKTLPDQETAKAVYNGTTSLCWDGQYFFSDSHPVNVDDSTLGTFDNNLTGATYNLALDPKGAWSKAKAAMMKFLDDGGKPLNAMPDTLLVGPDLLDAALTIAEASTIVATVQAVQGTGNNVAAAGVTNIYQGKITVVCSSWLTSDTTAGYALDTKKSLKPFLWQLREPVMFKARINPEDPKVFDTKKLTYGVDGRGQAGYGLPWTAIRLAPS